MRTESDCIFCKIVAGEIPCFKVYENDATLCFMDINPAHDGHALVISKEHWENVHVIPDELISAVTVTAKKIAGAVDRALSPDGLNLLQCNGPGAAQSVPHFHMHVLPRAIGDDLRLNWGLTAGDMEMIKQHADRIVAAL